MARRGARTAAGAVEPRRFQLRGHPPRVTRLSRKALAVVGVAAGLGGSTIYALKPAGQREANEFYSTESRGTVRGHHVQAKDYTQTPKLGQPLPGDLGRPVVSAQQRGDTVPVPPIGTTATQPDPALRLPKSRGNAPSRNAMPLAPAWSFLAAAHWRNGSSRADAIIGHTGIFATGGAGRSGCEACLYGARIRAAR